MVFRLIRDLPGVRDLVVTVAREIIASHAWRQPRGARTTRLRRPQQRRSSRDTDASIASRLTFRDDSAYAPLAEAGRRNHNYDFQDRSSDMFLREALDRHARMSSDLPVGQ